MDLKIIIGFLGVLSLAKARPATECVGKASDIVFVLDSSNSVWEPDFKKQLVFVREVIETFNIGQGQDQTRVGVITFGHDVNPKIYLNNRLTRDELMLQISQIEHGRGRRTETAMALNYATKNMFSEQMGARPDVNQIAVVITDGHSFRPGKTRNAAFAAHDAGINVFAIGVGQNIDMTELHAIASDPDEDFLFQVGNYTALESIREKLSVKACEVTAKPVTTTTTRTTTTFPETTEKPSGDKDVTVTNCGGKPADVYFVIDSSSSISLANFRKEIQFVKDVVDIFDVADDKTRVGALTFSHMVKEEIPLDSGLTKEVLLDKLDNTEYLGRSTDTAFAIRHLRLSGFSKKIARPEVAHVAIVLTDGMSRLPEATRKEATLARRMGIYMFAIGIGNQTDLLELRDIASDPDKDFVFQVNDFNSLDSIKNVLAIKTCDVEPDQRDRPVDLSACEADLDTDMLFVYDTAATGGWKSQMVSQYVAEVVGSFDSTSAARFLQFGRMTDNCVTSGGNIPLTNNLHDIHFSTVHVPTFAHLLKKVRQNGFSASFGARRRDVSKMAVLFVDDDLDQIDAASIKEVKRLQTFVDVYIVGIGNNLDSILYSDLVGDDKFVHAHSYAELFDLKDTLMSKVCPAVQIDWDEIFNVPPV